MASNLEFENDQALGWLTDALQLERGLQPFPWQLELLRRFRRGLDVSAIDIPTGLGKTATMAVWLVARALGASLPRRLVYVVDRRAVVDQATEVAESLRAWVAREREVAEALGLGSRPLPISTLRGQHVDNRAWLEDPSSPAIVVGTVDMVGSRLLFSGYGVSTKMRPYHAGLLGADTLVVLDEAHLVPAFEDLLIQVERGADLFGPKESSLRALVPPFKLLSLSATGRHTAAAALTLSDDDWNNPVVKKRLTAKKALRIVDLAYLAAKGTTAPDDGKNLNDADEATKKSKGPKLADVLANQAWQLAAQGAAKVRCLVFCNAREDATAVAAELRNLAKSARKEPTIELFVGARRVKERTMVATWLADHGFVEQQDGSRANPKCPTFLVATSAGEVGVDMDADHVVCDLVAWERMVQRLGRVNRRGDADAKVVVVVDVGSPDENELRAALHSLGDMLPKEQKRTLELFDKRKKATAASARLKQEKLSFSESKALKKQVGDFRDADAKNLAKYEAEVLKHQALVKILDAVAKDGGSLSPDALVKLRARQDLANALRAATTVEPLRPELTRALLDSWSMTSLDEHPGRPEVDPWLRGFHPNDQPQTTVIWRRHLPVRADGTLDVKAVKRFFEAAPPHTSEQLETETPVVLDWLVARASAKRPEPSKAIKKLLDKRSFGGLLSEVQQSELADFEAQVYLYEARPREHDVVAVLLKSRGDVAGQHTLSELRIPPGDNGKRTREQLIKQLSGAILVIDARLGGVTDGLLNPNENAIAAAADDGTTLWIGRSDAVEVPVTGFRIRAVGASDEDESARLKEPGRGWVRRHLFVTNVADGEPSAALVIDGWAGDAATEDDRAEADRPQQLDEHQRWAEECARQIAQRLGLEQRYVDLMALAARLHDEGKRMAKWQIAFKAPIDGRPYAKTKGPIDFDLLDGYRHELGSLPYVEAHEDFKALGKDDQDFILHLVAAHHGFARPVIGVCGCDDAPPSIVEVRARAVALRFARLSRRWGPWGLAWWEALLRSADQTASRRNQNVATAQLEQP